MNIFFPSVQYTELVQLTYYCNCKCRLSEGEYDEIADETLESLADKFDVLVEEGVTSQDYDVQFAVCILLSTGYSKSAFLTMSKSTKDIFHLFEISINVSRPVMSTHYFQFYHKFVRQNFS